MSSLGKINFLKVGYVLGLFFYIPVIAWWAVSLLLDEPYEHGFLDIEKAYDSSIIGFVTLLVATIVGIASKRFVGSSAKILATVGVIIAGTVTIVSLQMAKGMGEAVDLCMPRHWGNFELLKCPEPVDFWGGGSFPGEMLVVGQVPIALQSITSGTILHGFDIESRKVVEVEVVAVRTRLASDIYEINGILEATSEHPFAVLLPDESIIWRKASELGLGDCLVTQNGECKRVDSLNRVEGGEKRVYNIQVSGPENYFVLLNGVPVLVHNKSVPA